APALLGFPFVSAYQVPETLNVKRRGHFVQSQSCSGINVSSCQSLPRTGYTFSRDIPEANEMVG
ncbi:TPA: hypothetical protein ACIUS4_004906, partial [Shigella sonnei]